MSKAAALTDQEAHHKARAERYLAETQKSSASSQWNGNVRHAGRVRSPASWIK